MLIGLICTALAAVLIFPIPLGNLLPATAIAILGLSLVHRDGALAVVGYLTAAISFGVLMLSGQVVMAAVTGSSLGWASWEFELQARRPGARRAAVTPGRKLGVQAPWRTGGPGSRSSAPTDGGRSG